MKNYKNAIPAANAELSEAYAISDSYAEVPVKLWPASQSTTKAR